MCTNEAKLMQASLKRDKNAWNLTIPIRDLLKRSDCLIPPPLIHDSGPFHLPKPPWYSGFTLLCVELHGNQLTAIYWKKMENPGRLQDEMVIGFFRRLRNVLGSSFKNIIIEIKFLRIERLFALMKMFGFVGIDQRQQWGSVHNNYFKSLL